jgi:hypothetical protein
MTDMEINVELEVLDDAELDEVTGGLFDFSGIRTINFTATGVLSSNANIVGNGGVQSGGLNVGFVGVAVA